MSSQISKSLLKKYLDTEERYIINMLKTETDDVEKHSLNTKLRLIIQISDDFELEDGQEIK